MRLEQSNRISYVFLNYCPLQFTTLPKHDTIQAWKTNVGVSYDF